MGTPSTGRRDCVPRGGSRSALPAPAQWPAEPFAGAQRPSAAVTGVRGRGRERGGVCALLLAGIRWAGCGLPRSGPRLAQGGRRGRAQRAAPPTPVRVWARGLRAGGGGGSSGKRWAGTGDRGRSLAEVPLGGAWAREPEGAPFASSRGSPSQGAPPQGHRATAGRVPGVAGPIPPPSRAQVRPGPRGA